MNTTDPVAFLLSEHRRIMAAVDAVRRALPDLRSPEDFRRHLPALLAFGDALTYDIPAHAGKEDDIFFPPIEAIIGREGGPTGVMRAEHKEIHAAALKLSEVIRELNTVEHPAILAGTQAYEAQIRAVQAGAGDLAAFVAHAVSHVQPTGGTIGSGGGGPAHGRAIAGEGTPSPRRLRLLLLFQGQHARPAIQGNGIGLVDGQVRGAHLVQQIQLLVAHRHHGAQVQPAVGAARHAQPGHFCLAAVQQCVLCLLLAQVVKLRLAGEDVGRRVVICCDEVKAKPLARRGLRGEDVPHPVGHAQVDLQHFSHPDLDDRRREWQA
ncbi:MAG: hemerythrin domain-containing protein [Chloroflexi bacterium]|nr:hemerythrin domain-containing protein [Chloroflexota bacterium]